MRNRKVRHNDRIAKIALNNKKSVISVNKDDYNPSYIPDGIEYGSVFL